MAAGHAFARRGAIRFVFHDDAAVRVEFLVFRADQHGQRAHGCGHVRNAVGQFLRHIDDCVQTALQSGDGQRVLCRGVPYAFCCDVLGERVGEQARTRICGPREGGALVDWGAADGLRPHERVGAFGRFLLQRRFDGLADRGVGLADGGQFGGIVTVECGDRRDGEGMTDDFASCTGLDDD